MTSGFGGFGPKTTTTASPFGTGGITFGTPTAQTQPTFNFGGASTTPQQGGFQLGGASTTPQQGGFQLGGIPATTASTGFGLFGAQMGGQSTGFGGAMTTTQPTQATGLFGAPAAVATATTTTSGLSFGLPSATPAFSFGPPASTSTTLTFGTSSANNAGTGLFGSLSTATPSLSFGTSTSQALNLSAPTSSTGLNFGFGAVTTSQPLALPTSTATPSTSAPMSSILGLGGVATTLTKTTMSQKEVPPKEQPLPTEILQTVEHFKQFVKQQKNYSSEIARCSVKEYRKVEEELDTLTNTMNEVESELNKNRQAAEKLKFNTAKCFRDVEMAQRTQDTPPGLQYENTAPLQFFLELTDHFEKEMQILKAQIESIEKQIKDHKNSNIITPNELNMGLKRLYETFVVLAGRLYTVHNQVEAQKEAYQKWRQEKFNDNSNPFEELTREQEEIKKSTPLVLSSPPKVVTGPTPFSNLIFTNEGLLPSSQGSGGEQSSGLRLAGGLQSTSLFGATAQTPFNTSTNFQLQRPPTGNKRGKQ